MSTELYYRFVNFDTLSCRDERIHGEQTCLVVKPKLRPIRQKRLEHQADFFDRRGTLAGNLGIQVV